MRRALILVLAVGCDTPPAPSAATTPIAPASPTAPAPVASSATPSPNAPVVLAAHAGAVALYGGPQLVMSYTMAADGDQPGKLRLSRGNGPIARTLDGWPIGVVGDRAYILEPAGAKVRVERVGFAGAPEPLAVIDPPGRYYHSSAVVTGTGHVVVAVPDEHGTRAMAIAPDGETRDLPVVRATDAVATLAADPASSTVALLAQYTRGDREPGAPEATLVFVDAATGAIRAKIALPRLSAIEGEAAFVGGKLAMHLEDGIWSFDPASGARTLGFATAHIDARALAFAPRGDAVAWVHWVHPSDVMPLSMTVACQVWIDRAGVPRPDRPALELPTGCYYGAGLLFVGDALWVATP